jgi:hypothetical protein
MKTIREYTLALKEDKYIVISISDAWVLIQYLAAFERQMILTIDFVSADEVRIRASQ